jgi:ectoine hydroxylase-related dioxygenase (phytanoyl-CoA dioxygenase family)
MSVNLDVASFDDVGYVVVPDVLGADEAADLHAAIGALSSPVDGDPSGPTRKLNERTLLEDRRFFDAMTRPRLLDVVREVLGEDLQLLCLDVLDTPPHAGARRAWHADFAFPTDAVLTVNVGLYLQDMSDEAGPLYVVPGSHRRAGGPTDDQVGEEMADEVAVHVRAGTAVVFNSLLWHTGSRNESDRPRRAIFPYFGHYWIKRMDEFYRTPLPAYVSESDDPLVRQLFGLGLIGTSVHGEGYDADAYG